MSEGEQRGLLVRVNEWMLVDEMNRKNAVGRNAERVRRTLRSYLVPSSPGILLPAVKQLCVTRWREALRLNFVKNTRLMCYNGGEEGSDLSVYHGWLLTVRS